MRITTGRVVGETIVIEGEPLAEGISVTFDEGGFELDADDARQLSVALAEARSGEGTEGEVLLRRIDAE